MILQDIRDIIETLVGDGDIDELDRFINMGTRDVYNAGLWPERVKTEFKETIAPFSSSTGNLTNGAAALSDTTATLLSSHAGRKFSGDYNSPWYEIDSFTDADNVTLERNFLGTTMSSAAYIIYEDRVVLPSDCRVLLEVWIHDSAERRKMHFRPGLMPPTSTDAPFFYTREERDSNGDRRIRVGPYAPDAAYGLELIYAKDYVDMTDGADVCPLDEERCDLAIQRILYWAYQRDHFQRSLAANQEYLRLLKDHRADTGEDYPGMIVLGEPLAFRRNGDDPGTDFGSLDGTVQYT